MDILKNMRHTFNPNLVSAIMSEKSSSYSRKVLMKIKDDGHAEMKVSLEDSGRIMEADDHEPPTRKSTNDKMETSK